MAHFAQLDENNIVTNVFVVGNDDVQNLPFPQSEPLGIAFLQNLLPDTTWKQTSYNNNFRIRYAGIGDKFHAEYGGEHGCFVPPALYDYFVFDAAKCFWVPPVPYPTDNNRYYWSDRKRAWLVVPPPKIR
jgi:hypothetical protein